MPTGSTVLKQAVGTITVLLYFVSLSPPHCPQDTSLNSFTWYTRPCRMSPDYTLTLLPNLLQAHLHGMLLTGPWSFLLCILAYALPFARNTLSPSSIWSAGNPHSSLQTPIHSEAYSEHTRSAGCSRRDNPQCLVSPSVSARTAWL